MISGALAILETDKQRNELSEFYKENKTRLYRFAFSRLHNRESAEDALQEAFLNIWLSLLIINRKRHHRNYKTVK